MDLASGGDLISLQESLQSQYSPSSESPPSPVDAVQYARCNGLTVNNLLFDWHHLVEHDQAITSTLIDVEQGQLIEGTQLQECLFRAIIPTTEQWQMPAASLQTLQQVCRRCKEDEVAALASQQCFAETGKWKAFKLEASVLRSDHGTDCRRLARRVKAFMKGSLPDHRLPLHPVDVESGEGLEFPKGMTEKDAELMHDVERENFAVARDTLVYLMQSLKVDWTDGDRRDFVESVSTYQGIDAREHLTPPLSPMLEAYPEPFVPADDFCELPELSDPSSRLSEDIEAAESRIFEADNEFWAEALNTERSPGRYDGIDVPGMIRAGELRPPIPPSSPQPLSRDLKIEVPLLPCSDDGGNTMEVVRVLAPNDLAEAKQLVASSDTLSGSDGPTGQLVAFFQQSATAVMRTVEQEKLQPLDATARAPVPVLDFSIPIPEWEQRLWEAKAMFRWIQKDIDVDWQGPKWAHNRAAEQRMVWAPLAHMKEKKLVSEQIEADSKVLDFLLKRSRDGDVPISADYVYKTPGLATFRMVEDEDDEEDCLEPLYSPQKPPSSPAQGTSWERSGSSATGSSLALQCSSPPTAETTTSSPAGLTSLLSGRKRLLEETFHKGQPSVIDSTLFPSTSVLKGFVNEYTDFGPLVDNFVEMNFPKKPKLTNSPFFAPAGSTTPGPSQSKADEAAKLMPPPPKPIPALAPNIIPPEIPPRIVVPSTLSAPITQYLKNLLPNIELIPRNYDKHRPPNWTPGMRPPNLDEADIVVSPATGILLTTMIQLRQRALPHGNRNHNNNTKKSETTHNFRRITENVSVRHERVIILISEGNKHSETASPLSQSDAKALTEFQGFAAGLRTTARADVQVLYVGGGVETLAKWVVAVIGEHAGEAVGVREMLLPVETYWEVFLRKAGMNVFAAQVVLGMLNVPEESGGLAIGRADGEVFGLPLFLMMSRERRIELFEGVFGGRRVLERVCEVIDERWGEHAVDDGGFGTGMAHFWGGLPGGNAL